MGEGEKNRRATEGYEEIAESLIRGRQADVRGREKKAGWGGMGGLRELGEIKMMKKQKTALPRQRP